MRWHTRLWNRVCHCLLKVSTGIPQACVAQSLLWSQRQVRQDICYSLLNRFPIQPGQAAWKRKVQNHLFPNWRKHIKTGGEFKLSLASHGASFFLTAQVMILSTIILSCAHLCLTLSWMRPLLTFFFKEPNRFSLAWGRANLCWFELM